MSRSKGPEPFFRADRGLWYVQIGNKQHNLGKDAEEAKKRWHALMAAPPPADVPEDPLVVTVVDEFLTWTEQHREKRTYGWYLNYLQGFVSSLPDPTAFTVSRLKPFHVEKWASAAKGKWGPSYRHGAIRSVQRCFRWAERQGYIQLSPVRHVE